jgi:transglutaminase-like putative cysteine protease
MRYLMDPEGGEYFIDPLALIQQIQGVGYAYGDCDDHVGLLNAMARSVGFETRAVGVHLNDPVLWDHVISQVNVMGNWLDIDPCVKTNETPKYREKLV